MGMFDMLYCDAVLPLPEMQSRNFQTKAFDCELDQYRITKDGVLIHYARELTWVSDPTSFLGGHLDTVREWEERLDDFHGDVSFYEYLDEARTTLVTFRARFTDGKLIHIIEVEREVFS